MSKTKVKTLNMPTENLDTLVYIDGDESAKKEFDNYMKELDEIEAILEAEDEHKKLLSAGEKIITHNLDVLKRLADK